MRQKNGAARAGIPATRYRAEQSPDQSLGGPPPRTEGSSNNSSWLIVTEEMVGGQHRVDEGKRAEQVRVTQMSRCPSTLLRWRTDRVQMVGVVRDAFWPNVNSVVSSKSH